MNASVLYRPFFSVIIATYNRLDLLSRAVCSLLQQSENNWELIIVDDGSMDNTKAWVAQLMREKSTIENPIRYHFQENKGSFYAKNVGMELANGKYITFLDSDDQYKKNHLAHRKSILVSNPNIDLLHGGVDIIGSPFVPDRFNPTTKIRIIDCAVGGTFFIRSRVLSIVGGFKKMPVGLDGDFLERVQKHCLKIYKTTEPSYIYHHEVVNSITNKLS